MKFFHWKNKRDWNAGFTLFEALLSLLILSGVVLLFFPIINIGKSMNEQLLASKQMEWHLFLIQLNRELIDFEIVEIQNEKMYFEKINSGDQLLVEKYSSLIRKRKNKKGHQPLLTDVQQLRFTQFGSSIKLEVTFTNEEHFEGQLIIY